MPNDGQEIRHAAPVSPKLTVRIPEACRITGIGRSKLYELIRAGDIETIKLGTMTLIPMESLSEFIHSLRGTASDPPRHTH